MIEKIIVLAFLVMMSAFFSAAEIALFSLSRLKVRQMIDNKAVNAKIIKKLKDEPQKLLTTILVGNNLVNILASVYATTIAMEYFQSHTIAIVTGIMTFTILIFAEIIPKSVGSSNPELTAQVLAWPILWIQYILLPLILVFEIITKMGSTIIGKETPIVTKEELKSMIAAGEEVGEIKKIEKEMIDKIFKFDDMNASHIMTPRGDMIVVNMKASLKEALKKIVDSGFSRLPVYEKTRDKIVGVLYIKDVVEATKKEKIVEQIMKPADFVPTTKKVDDLLDHFQQIKKHMAIVIDENGVVQGLVTLEDVLEEIVGEILDERDKVEPNIKKLNKTTWMVMGKTPIEEFTKKFGIEIDKQKDYETASGYIISKIGKIPESGEEIELNNHKIIIEESRNQRLVSFKIMKK